ncbi:LamGL domain-containing protein [Chloropicon primus]|uniref:LamG-like jellyroll fold domain-containing protein n=2 Tax=Chloropicon primus TaxID=1764295 RepID=A0A5B8MKQ8_9CHLO|nr:hypothetical protein A3770_04p33690 [Chloropicon primus]UPR00064.1 LamGL domain-containing protein [Chloropicon primus]|eukprot:QDZ20851.1 hypothetical protein A3770_04p33690 [Chloropicon primus]
MKTLIAMRYLIVVLALSVGLAGTRALAQGEDEVLQRFDCKMALTWRPAAQRFAFVSDDITVVTACTYENFMWHHVVVSIDEQGKGQLVVDGKAQVLLNEDLTSHAGGEYFQTGTYPNKCPTGSADDCCTMRVASKCSDPGKYNDFDGIVDELGVWKRPLSVEEVADAMFKAPAYLPSTQVVAPTSNQTNTASGRVLWGKFNQACSNSVTDGPLSIVGLGGSAKYVYNGVPWLAPEVTTVPAEIPLDGGLEITVKGVGLAKSPFTHCVLVHPDPMGYYGEASNADTLAGSTSANGRLGYDAFSFNSVTYSHARAADGPAAEAGTRGGKIPSFQVHATSQLLGFHDTMKCSVPKASNIAEGYRLAVSNDGGMTVGNTKPTVAKEFSVEFDGTVTLTGSGTPSQSSLFTVSLWVYPKKNVITSTVVELGSPQSPFGLYFENGLLVVRDSPLGGQGVAYVPMSLNTWHYLQLSVGPVGVQGNQLTARLDGMAFHGPTGFRSSSPKLSTIGTGYHGYIDELKIYDEHISDMSVAFTRELSPLKSIVATYYRFNGNLKNAVEGRQSSEDIITTESSVTYSSHFAPWEPTVVYSVNNQVVKDGVGSVPYAVLGGTMEVTGYNFAESEFLRCKFGAASEGAARMALLDQYNQSAHECSVPSAGQVLVGEAGETRTDGREFTKHFYPSFEFSGSSSLSFDPASKTDSKVVCELSFDPSEYTTQSFSVVNSNGFGDISGPTLSKLDVQSSGNSLKCNGPLDFGNILSEDLSTYAVSFWTWVPEGGSATNQIVLSFEAENTVHGSVVFNGEAFSYYDDNILNTGTTQSALETDMWHFVVLSIDAEGEGRLYVDCDLTSAFTTASRPPKDSRLHVCGSSSKVDELPYYQGLVDEIKIFKDFSDKQTLCPAAFTDKTNALAHYSMNLVPLDVGAPVLVDEMQGGFITGRKTHVDTFLLDKLQLVKASAPWEDPHHTTEDVDSILHGGKTTVKVSGINLAPSPFFRIRSKDGTIPSISTSKEAQSIASASILVDGQCYEDSSLEITNNFHTSSGVTKTFDSFVGVVNLFDGLVEHFTLDGSEENRDLIQKSATRLPVSLPVADLNARTICAWVLLEDYIDVHVDSAGWKFVCHTEDESSSLVYLNGYLANGEVAAFYENIMVSFKETGKAFGDHSGLIDDMWVYNRVLSACEVEARYYTTDYALASDQDDTATLPSTGPLGATTEMTIEAWIKPLDVDGLHVIARSKNENEVSFYIVDGSLALSVSSKACTCTACPEKHEHISDKARVTADRWSHVAASYDGSSMSFYVDGVVKDTVPMSGVGKVIDSGGLTMATSQMGLNLGFESFKGLLHSMAVFSAARTAEQVKLDASCPQKDTSGVSLISFNEDNSAGFHQNLANASYSDPVDSQTMTLNLKSPVASGSTVSFAAVARSACGKMAMAGGMELGAVLSKGAFQANLALSDAGDGNYHGVLDAKGLACGDYKLTVAPSNLVDVPVSIVPGETVAHMSEIVVPTTVECFGIPRTVSLVAKDANGCPVLTGGDSFKIHITGPHSVTIDAQYTGADGIYTGTFTPEIPGAYSMSGELLSGPDQGIIGQEADLNSTKFVCMDVCMGRSKEFSGTDSIIFSEGSSLDLDVAYDEMTIDFWLNAGLTIGREALLLVKTSAESGSSKGYSVSLDPTFNTLSISLYTSLGEYRSLTVPSLALQGKGWYHIAITYTGTELSAYGNGNKIAAISYDTKKAVHSNPYSHPLEIGQGFVGLMDEIKFWKVALTPEEIHESMYCPPYKKLKDLATYFHFNQNGLANVVTTNGHVTIAGTTTHNGFEATPVKSSSANPFAVAGVTAKVVSGEMSLKYSTVSFDVNTYEAGVTGPLLSNGTGDVVSKSTAPVFKITARDQCGYHYTKGESVFSAFATPLTNKFSDESISSVDLAGAPASSVFPVSVEGIPKDVSLASSGFVCSSGVPSGAYPSISNEYYGVIDVEKAGRVKVAVNGLAEEIVEMVPSQPKSLSIDKKYDMESGLLGSVDFSVLDEGSNVILDEYDMDVSFIVSMTQYANIPTSTTFSDGHYKLYFIPPVAGVYAMTIKIKDQPSISGYELLTIQPGAAKPVIVEGYSAGGGAGSDAFEHAALVKGNSLVTFGGGNRNSFSYSNDVWELENYNVGSSLLSNGLLGFMKRFEVSGAQGEDLVVGLVVNTEEAIASGKMTSSCSDLYFTNAHDHKMKLSHAINPSPGCGAKDTIVYVKIPAAMLSTGSALVDLFHGGNLESSESPEDVYAFHAGFEGAGTGSSLAAYCGASTVQHSTSSKNPYMGSSSLRVSGSSDSLELLLGPAADSTKYKLQAYLYDSGLPTSSSHFLALNGLFVGSTCSAHQGGADTGPLVAFGIHTACHSSKYCIYDSGSWTSSAARRYPHWVLLEVESDGQTLQMSIDGSVVLTREAMSLSKAYLSVGSIVDQSTTGFWDEISVVTRPGESTAVTEVHSGPALFSPHTQWKKLEASGTKPPERLGHTAVLLSENHMAVFGGERNTHLFNDIHVFSFDQLAWTSVSPYEGPDSARPRARYDHIAWTWGGEMFIHGGLTYGGEVLDDLWHFNFDTGVWKEITSLTGSELSLLGKRFGHSVAERSGTFYIFGGYSAGGSTNDFFSVTMPSSGLDSTGAGPPDGFGNPVYDQFIPTGLTAGMNISGDSLSVKKLESSSLPPRFAHSSFVDGESIYIIGGNDEDNSQMQDLWAYNVASGQWTKTQIEGSASCEAVAFSSTGGYMVLGGKCGSSLLPGGDTHLLHLPL